MLWHSCSNFTLLGMLGNYFNKIFYILVMLKNQLIMNLLIE